VLPPGRPARGGDRDQIAGSAASPTRWQRLDDGRFLIEERRFDPVDGWLSSTHTLT
jgi:hypothetical protein